MKERGIMRLIDADALKARFYMKDDCSDCHACDYDETYIDPGIICSTIDDMPTIEPKIIRCNECKYRGGKPIADGRCWCSIHNTFMSYCSDAERKDNG